MATVDGINAKNIDYKQPGTGAAWTQTNQTNLLPKLGTLWNERNQREGGSAEIYKNFQDWFNKDYAARMAQGQGTPNATDTALQNYFQTGKYDGIDPGYAMLGFDKAVRGTGQHQQHKADGSFFDSFLTDFLPEIALSFVNPYLAAGYGALKGGIEDGWGGAALGGLKGYSAGQLGAGMGSEFTAAGGFDELLSHPLEFAKTFGYNVAGDIGSGVSNAWNTVSNLPSEIAGVFSGGAPGAAAPITEAGQLAGGLPAGGATAYPLASAPPGIPFVNGAGVGSGLGDAGAAAGSAGGLTDTALQTLPGVGTALTNATAGAAPIVEQGTQAAAGAAPGFASKAMSALGKLGSPAQLAMLGLTGAQALMGPQTSTAEKTLARQAGPYNAEAKQLMDFYNSGNLHPSDEQQLKQYEQQEMAKINEYWARAGAPNSTGRLQMQQDLQTKLQALRDQTRQSYLASALQAGGLGTQATQTLAQLQQLGDNQASQALTNMMQQLAFSNAYASRAA